MRLSKLSIALALAGCSLAASADMVLKGDDVTLRLTMQPCPPVVAGMVPADFRDKFHWAPAVIKDRQVAACWYPLEGGRVFVKFEDGSFGPFDLSDFERDPGV